MTLWNYINRLKRSYALTILSFLFISNLKCFGRGKSTNNTLTKSKQISLVGRNNIPLLILHQLCIEKDKWNRAAFLQAISSCWNQQHIVHQERHLHNLHGEQEICRWPGCIVAKILEILEKSIFLLSGVVQHISSGIPSNFSQALTVIAVGHCPAYQTANFQPLQGCDN